MQNYAVLYCIFRLHILSVILSNGRQFAKIGAFKVKTRFYIYKND